MHGTTQQQEEENTGLKYMRHNKGSTHRQETQLGLIDRMTQGGNKTDQSLIKFSFSYTSYNRQIFRK